MIDDARVRDAEARTRAVRERSRNVIVEASAGTGKTKLVVDRIVELVAPSDGSEGIPLDRIAAITFTRKAAGELRVRTRQRLLDELVTVAGEGPRRRQLSRALGEVDTASIGTIHSFSDSILRKWPAEARLDPNYELMDSSTQLLDETFRFLVECLEEDRLHEVPGLSRERVAETVETLEVAARAGIRHESQSTEFWTYHGLDGFCAGMILHREVDVHEPTLLEFDRATFRRYVVELAQATSGLADSPGAIWLKRIARRASDLVEDEPCTIYWHLVAWALRGPRNKSSITPTKKVDFAGDDAAWDAWKAFDGDERRKRVRDGALRDDLLAPLQRWLAIRLVRLRPVVLAVYEHVKARRGVVDHVDLLLRLRNLLRDHAAVRVEARTLYMHILVDEFQDTDPLQLEIVRLLCGDEETGTFRPGTLTVVGDPKQSIYRFRRADIVSYQSAIDELRQTEHLEIRLATTYRSDPVLVDWLNRRFVDILAHTYTPVLAGREGSGAPVVHRVPVALEAGTTADDARATEALAMARYVRWLVERSGTRVLDAVSGERRELRFGDIAVLTGSTSNLPQLFRRFDDERVPHAARGGVLFARDPLHRQFLLGLCAVADRDDGVAMAALLQPPFFALTLPELAREARDCVTDPVSAARAILRDIRSRRFARGPGATARALLEETAFGRVVALGPNGQQRLAGVRELCFQVELRAAEEQLDFDATVERFRSWIDEPAAFDRPHPVGGDTVRVLTIHQAKGLEFPVVVLWDSRAGWQDHAGQQPWTAAAHGEAWSVNLDTLSWSEPAGNGLFEREKALRDEERKRMLYVAATRARDLLVIPDVGERDNRWVLGRLIGPDAHDGVLVHPRHCDASPAPWHHAGHDQHPKSVRDVGLQYDTLTADWRLRATESSRPALRPRAFSSVEKPRVQWGKKGRYGTKFGEAVHLAIGYVLREGKPVRVAVSRGAELAGLDRHIVEAEQDVNRALSSLEKLRLRPEMMEFEYAVTGQSVSNDLVSGYIDLIAASGESIIVLDFKTDAPPEHGEEISERYRAQVVGYASVVRSGVSLPVRAGLLYTADGDVRWIGGDA